MKPRYYQLEAKEKLFSYIEKNKGKHPLIAMPTGSGKSLVIADIIKHIRNNWGDVNILVLSHVKEILKQDVATIESYIGEKVGLYSSGLSSKTILPVTVAGIQSVFRKANEFNGFDLIIIDEAHLISEKSDSMYHKFLGEIDAIYFGLTATPFRLGSGYIYGTKDSLFDDLIYDLTTLAKFNKLISEGYLCNLRTKKTQLGLNTDALHIRSGDFIDSEMSLAFDKPTITNAALNEVVKTGKDYKKWLIFAIDIEHAEHVAENLIMRGIPTGLVHSKMEFDRDDTIRKFKEGYYKVIVNVNVLTTGFDDPEIDLIALLRPTQSPVIHVQTIGRGLRTNKHKDHCMILDFAGNTARLGPINDIHISKKRKRKSDGEAIVKTCPQCDCIYHPSVKICEVCGYKFLFQSALESTCDGSEIISTGNKWYNITSVTYTLKSKANAPDIIKVSYMCNLKVFNEYWCLDHKGYARFVAIQKIKQRIEEVDDEDLTNCVNAMPMMEYLKTPNRILINESKKYPQILRYSFG